jgi:NAD(P)-dependent dehydrogenase (short-subunit alcohol dehydrogenase family)
MISSARAVAVVTGGASGIGYATAERLCAQGTVVVLADRDGEAAAQAAERLRAAGGAAEAFAVDVTERASVDRLIGQTVAVHGTLDLLVNCAGFAYPAPSAEIDDDEWAAQLDVHLGGTMRCCRAAHAALAGSPHPAIVNVSSVLGRVGNPERLAYSAAKAGIESMTRTLAVEWAPAGIRVNAVAPGYTRTALIERLAREGKLDAASLERRIPLGRLAVGEEVAGAIAFLCGPDARYVTGHTLVVDGGMSVEGDWSASPQC